LPVSSISTSSAANVTVGNRRKGTWSTLGNKSEREKRIRRDKSRKASYSNGGGCFAGDDMQVLEVVESETALKSLLARREGAGKEGGHRRELGGSPTVQEP